MLRQVSQGLDKIMELCHQLRSLVQTMSDPLTAKEKSQIDSIAMVRKKERERERERERIHVHIPSACNNDNIIFQVIIYFSDIQSPILSSVSYPFKREGFLIVSSFNSALAPDRL